jgi:hypothetical protein
VRESEREVGDEGELVAGLMTGMGGAKETM